MNNKKIGALLLAIASTTSYAGSMGPAITPERLLLLEGGFSYSYSFFQDSAVFPESVTPVTPNGFAINPNNFFPNSYYGGYIGASIYVPSNWLLNTRYDMYGKESKHNTFAETIMSFAPARLSFSVDKLWGDINSFSFGAGAGVVLETLNDGDSLIAINVQNPLSESLQGRSRLDPLVEAFGMYRFANNFGIKVNAGYQIPVYNKFSDGDLNVNVGINYSFAI